MIGAAKMTIIVCPVIAIVMSQGFENDFSFAFHGIVGVCCDFTLVPYLYKVGFRFFDGVSGIHKTGFMCLVINELHIPVFHLQANQRDCCFHIKP
jgi:hypothetical protein